MTDKGFCFPVKELSTDKVRLVPFNPSQHAQPYIEASLAYPEVYRYLSIGPFTTSEDFTTQFFENLVYLTPSMTAFVIIDTTKPNNPVAGIISYMSASAEHLCAELGFGIILPPYQRTHVANHAVALLIKYALDAPEQGGLGLRRLVWQADTTNPRSLAVAKRMGFRQEGILRWNRVAKNAEENDKAGNKRAVAPYMQAKDAGRDTVVLSMCWDDWLGGKKEVVEQLLLQPRTGLTRL